MSNKFTSGKIATLKKLAEKSCKGHAAYCEGYPHNPCEVCDAERKLGESGEVILSLINLLESIDIFKYIRK